MVRLVKNNTKPSINLQRYKNFKINIMMSKQWVIQYTITIKYYMNKKHMKNKSFQKIIWQVLY